MIAHVWSVVCESAIVDKVSNNLSLFNVLEKLDVVLGEPFDPNKVLPIAVTVATLWERSEDEDSGSMRINFSSPTGEVLKTHEFPLDFKGQKRLRTLIRIAGLHLRESGIYRFAIGLKMAEGDWQETASLPLELAVTQEVEGQPNTTPN